MELKIKKLSKNAQLPTRGSEEAAGWDLYADLTDNLNKKENEAGIYIIIPPYTTVKISTGLAMEIPKGYFGGIYARSGLATKQGLRPANCTGIIDSDYRGPIIIALFNDSDEERTIYNGDRIAQLIIQPYQQVELIDEDDLTDTDRGDGGFGSTGAR